MSWWSRRGPEQGTGRIDLADTAGITVANTGMIGSITIGPATYLLEDLPLAPASHPDPAALAPSQLLAARHQLVPFTGREAELEQLAGWRDGPAGVAAQLVYASGGQGKSRLASQFAAVSAAEGWLVWQARHRPAAAAYLPKLAMSLNNLGLTLSNLGRREARTSSSGSIPEQRPPEGVRRLVSLPSLVDGAS